MNPTNQTRPQTAPSEFELATRAVAPRVTQADVDAAIRSVEYATFPGSMLTVCVLTMQNGYTVTGESACASPENFQRDIGERLARADATRKIWPLLGFALRDRLAGPDVDYIARVCHEINRGYCLSMGDDSAPTWETAPEWQRNTVRLGVRLHIDNPNAGPSASHDSWMAEKLRDGWMFGAVKDPDAKTHPCIVAYEDLPREQQAKDHIFRAVVHALRAPDTRAAAGDGWPANKGRAPTHIAPTVGRVVWYFRQGAAQPWDAHVCHVNGDGTINVGGFDNRATPYAAMFVPLIQEGEPRPTCGPWCEWVPKT